RRARLARGKLAWVTKRDTRAMADLTSGLNRYRTGARVIVSLARPRSVRKLGRLAEATASSRFTTQFVDQTALATRAASAGLSNVGACPLGNGAVRHRSGGALGGRPTPRAGTERGGCNTETCCGLLTFGIHRGMV